MSKILTKTVKKTTLLSIVVAVILAAAIAVGIICGVKGYGVFNKSALLNDSKTLTVSLNQHAAEIMAILYLPINLSTCTNLFTFFL